MTDPLDALFITSEEALKRYGPPKQTMAAYKLPPSENQFWIVVTPSGEFEPNTLGVDKADSIIRHNELFPVEFAHTEGWQCVPVKLMVVGRKYRRKRFSYRQQKGDQYKYPETKS